MDLRVISAIILNLIAFFVPVVFLLEHFGGEARLDPESIEQLAAIAGAALFGFVVSTITMRLLQKGEGSALKQVADLLKSHATRA